MRLLHYGTISCALIAGLLLLDSTDYAASAATTASGDHGYRVPPNYAPSQPQPQPVSFSHLQHAGTAGLPCGTCHLGANVGADNMTLPESSICMSCHAVVATESAEIQKLMEYTQSGTAIGWVRIYSLLDGVNWSHGPHLGAAIDCRACHGDVAAMQVMSEATAITAMASCINCHRASDANAQCETCHQWPDSESLRRWSSSIHR